MRSLRTSGWVAVIGIVFALAVAGCAKKPRPPPPPPPDSDATPQAAQPLAFDELHRDSADRTRGDLDDWYRLEVPAAGTVYLELSAAQPHGSLPGLFLVLTERGGVAHVDPTRTGGRTRVVLSREVQPGAYLVWVGTEPEAAGSVPYEIRAHFKPKPLPPKPKPRPKAVAPVAPVVAPPPPAPAFETHVTSVVEIERGQDDAQFVTIAGGERMGFQPGFTGRLVDGGRTLGTFEIIEVYSGGSRVKIRGRLSGPVSGRTVVEVDVPTRP